MTWRPASFRVGQMRERITIQQATITQESGGSGEPVFTWSDFMIDVPASYYYSGGTERMRGRQLESAVNAVFVIRYQTSITTEMKVVFNGESYGIMHTNPVEGGRRYLELYCTK